MKTTGWKNEGEGLLSRVNAKGSKTWAIRRTVAGKKIFENFGDGQRAKLKALQRIEEIDEANRNKTPLASLSFGTETFGAVAEEALPVFQSQVKNPKDKSTIKTRTLRLCEKFGHLRLAEITANHLDQYRAFLLQEGYPNSKGINLPLSRKTVELYSDLFSRILDYAVSGNLLERNPVKDRKRFPKTDPLETRQPLNGKDWQLFKENLSEGWFRDAVIAYRYSGLRRNELIQLDWSNVDLDKKLLTVRGSVRLGKSVKRDKSNRSVPILPEVEEILKRNLKNQAAFPFPNGTNERIIVSTFESQWVNLRERLALLFETEIDQGRIKSYRIHDLRHGYAVECVQRGLALTALQKILGHSRLEETAVYAAFNDDQTIEAFWGAWNQGKGHEAK